MLEPLKNFYQRFFCFYQKRELAVLCLFEEDSLATGARYALPGIGEDACLTALRASLVDPDYRAG